MRRIEKEEKMKKPVIRDSFSVDDIHRVREYHYETTKNLSKEERLEEIRKKAENVKSKLREMRNKGVIS